LLLPRTQRVVADPPPDELEVEPVELAEVLVELDAVVPPPVPKVRVSPLHAESRATPMARHDHQGLQYIDRIANPPGPTGPPRVLAKGGREPRGAA
jgi:hypothetical protein